MIGEFNPGVITVPVTGFSVVINGVSKTFNMAPGNDAEVWWATNFPELLFSGPLGETLTNLSTQQPIRLAYRMEPANQDAVLSVAFTNNPTGSSSLDNDGWATVCFAPPQYVLAIDDKGMLPGDGIYSGTITPPLPGAVLSFNIQHYLPNGSNGRVFNVYSDQQGLVVSPDGATWQIDRANLASWFDDFPTASDFTGVGTYGFTISKMLGDENIIPGERTYTVDSNVTCQPTILPLPVGDFPAQLPDGERWTFTYRINGGAIQTHLENAFGVPMDTVLVNFLAYYGLFGTLVSTGNGGGTRAFLARYGQPITGGSANDPDRTSIQSNTIELLVNPDAPHDAVALMFGHSVTLYSCALVDWTKKDFE